MRTLTINAEKFHIPASWNELTPDQLLRVGQLSTTQRSPADFKLKVLLKVTGLTVMLRHEVMIDDEPHYYLQSHSRKIHLVSLAALNEVCEAIDFMFEVDRAATPPQWMLSSRLTRNIIGPLKTQRGLWYGPADYLANLVTEEYIRAEVSLYRYYETHRVNYLDVLVATLWRPVAASPTTTDVREPFDDGAVASRAVIASVLPAEAKNAVLMFYEGCRKALNAKFRSASGGKGKADKDIFMQFMRMVNGLANNDVTKHEQVRRAPLMDTMITIDELARQQQELEQKMKKHRK